MFMRKFGCKFHAKKRGKRAGVRGDWYTVLLHLELL